LHRYDRLSAIYTVPALAATSTDAIAQWISAEVDRPIVIGPDEESFQWVDRIARAAGARATVLRKVRSGDFSVSLDGDGLADLGKGTPVIVDDIASSARTMIEAVRLVRSTQDEPPVCVAVHAIFADDAYEQLRKAGPARVVSTNTVPHESNVINLAAPLAEAVAEELGRLIS
jgi:ribose-phosphate pyrophosphokinase